MRGVSAVCPTVNICCLTIEQSVASNDTGITSARGCQSYCYSELQASSTYMYSHLKTIISYNTRASLAAQLTVVESEPQDYIVIGKLYTWL